MISEGTPMRQESPLHSPAPGLTYRCIPFTEYIPSTNPLLNLATRGCKKKIRPPWVCPERRRSAWGSVCRGIAGLVRKQDAERIGSIVQRRIDIRPFAPEAAFGAIGHSGNDHLVIAHVQNAVFVVQHDHMQLFQQGRPGRRSPIAFMIARHAVHPVFRPERGERRDFLGQSLHRAVDVIPGEDDKIGRHAVRPVDNLLQPFPFQTRAHMRIRQLHDGKAVQGRRQVGQTQFNGTDIGHANGLPGSPDAKNKGQRAHPRFQRRQEEKTSGTFRNSGDRPTKPA